MTIIEAIGILEAECGCAELDLSNEECINEKSAKAFVDACHIAIQALRDKDAEENGLLVRLPCKVGDTVWVAYPEARDKSAIYPCKVQSIYLTDDNNSKARSHLNIRSHISIFTKRMNLSEIGKTVFLTREEAMQALKARDTK